MGALACEMAEALRESMNILKAENQVQAQVAKVGLLFLKREFFWSNPDEFLGDPKEPLKANEWLEQMRFRFTVVRIPRKDVKCAIGTRCERCVPQFWDSCPLSEYLTFRYGRTISRRLGSSMWHLDYKPQSISAGMFILSKAALNKGINSFVFMFYRQLAGTISVTPTSFVALCKVFMLSLIGITLGYNIYGIALVYTSSSLAAAITNCLQTMTFFLAVLLRMEKLKLRTIGGVAKVAGIMLCMGGVATLAFYKGPYLKPFLHNYHPFDSNNNSSQQGHGNSPGENWIKGCFLMFLSNLCWALWIVYQAPVLKDYPSKLLIFTNLQCLFSVIQTGVVAIVAERDLSKWKLGWDARLVAIVYSGFLTSAVGTNLLAWLIKKKGPVFQAMWTPLSLVITILFSTFLLGEAGPYWWEASTVYYGERAKKRRQIA
ncbi:hypothetical protein HYC85_001582 [Camellia sinensis]|uniref:EamA domain-containing protein n=1 Tax=Camellia sinensis TaxID=4442 RepID=A0A7J7I5U4_CAMSI|nr:hypothetical protein HYC85_001582 [Camellia sinensis]